MRKTVGVIAGCGLVGAAFLVIGDGAAAPERAAATGLAAFDSCGSLVSYLEEQAASRVVSPPVVYETDARTAGADTPGTDTTGADATAPTQPETHSATNVQEAGVDEPDLAKTDGEILATAAGGNVHLYDVSGGGTPRELSHVPVTGNGHDTSLLLVDDTLLVFSTVDGARGSGTAVQQVDIADPARPDVTSTLEVDARLLDVRRSGDRVSLVTGSHPTITGPVADTTIEDWLPGYRLRSHDGRTSGTLVGCDRVRRPDPFPGFGTVTVLSFDVHVPLSVDDTTSVLAGGDVVYATDDSLYVATTEFTEEPIPFDRPTTAIAPRRPTGIETSIHAFGLTGDGPAAYLASGTVDGRIKDRFALSEHDDVLRVATTITDDSTTSSQLVTLTRDGGDLVELGSVGGLGKNEDIYAVRYLGDTAYVVTFRRTDPLYVIDLSDPRRPRATGELKVTGYSGYLHSVGDGRLIGVGQEATTDGRTIGAQVSLFDVSDPADPTKLDGFVAEGARSIAESDPHAFLYWAETGQLAIPLDGGTGGAVVLTVDDSSLHSPMMLEHAGPSIAPGEAAELRRNLVVGDTLYTVWGDGVQASSIDSLEPIGFRTFG